MRTNKRRMISILTAFVMAFTVFGCTGLSFAEETPGAPADDQGVQTMGETEQEVPDEVTAPDETAGSEGGDEVATMGELNPVAGEPAETSVTISWTAVDPQTTGYDVRYEISVTSGSVSGFPQETKETSLEITGLKANTKYTFSVQAKEYDPEDPDTATDIGEPETVDVTTPAAALPAPTTKAPTAGYKTVSLSWNAVTPVNGGTISYQITGKGKTYTTTGTSYQVTGLTPRALTYNFKIKAIEKAGDKTFESPEADFPAVKTTDFSTQKLTGLISDPGYKAVLLEWNRMEDATGYKIYWRVGGERGNIDNVGRDSDGHNMMTFRSKKSRKYEVVAKPGKYEYLTEVKNPASGDKVTFDKRGLKELNHTYVYFYQFMVIPYYDDNEGAPIYTSAVPGNKWKDSDVNSTANNVAGKSNLKYNIIRNNTVLPMYVYETAKVNKPIYKTCSMNDGKKRGRLAKGHKFICFDKANGRVKIYEKKNVSNPKATYWFAQKNAHTIQGYYMNNGNKNNLNRKDWKTGYSKKTVLDFVNNSGLSSKTNYLIWASKYAQHVYIFTGKKGNWKLLNGGKTTGWKNKAIWSNLCTSGKVNIQSRNGNYVIFGKQHTAKRSKYTYYYLSKLHTTVRLHSLLHKKGQKFGGKLYNKALGNPVSKGCIRLRPKVSKWIYDKVPKKTRCKVW